MARKSTYKKGREAEKKVARSLRQKGHEVTLSEGSRGAADIIAKKKNKKWAVQVKSRKGNSTTMTKKEKTRLKIKARKTNSVPVEAIVKPRKRIKYKSVRTGRKLKP